MLAITRRKVIKELLQEHKSVTITDLASRMDVTKETIRRDLRAMEKDGELIRTHGGAYILEGVQNDIDISTRQDLKTLEKEILAEKCDALIQPGDIIYLDNSTTAWFIARKIANRKLTVLTSSLEIANILQSSSTIRLFLIGGEFSAKTKSFIGENSLTIFQQYFLDKAFLSCRSVCMHSGATDTNDTDAAFHKIALNHSDQTYLVVDTSKLDNASFSYVADIGDFDGIVLDKEFSPEWKDYLNRHNVRYY